MPVELTDRARLLRDAKTRTRLCEAGEILLRECKRADSHFTIAIIDDEQMALLNFAYRGKNVTTDVLAFSQLEGEELASGDAESLGDVIISMEVARRQARDGGWKLEEELLRLLVHGFLHLLGHDHEAGKRKADRMFAEERRLIEALAAEGYSCAREELH
jgi:rRNA maturation RNase YbeY